MAVRTVKFKKSFDLTIDQFLRLSAPSGDLLLETILELDQTNDDEPEIKESKEVPSPAVTLIDPVDYHSLNLTPEIEKENEEAALEKKEFKQFFRDVRDLQQLVLADYQKAESDHDNFTMDYLDNFSNEVVKVVTLVKRNNATLKEKKQAINNLISAACPSSTLAKNIAPIVSPVLGLAGGCIGLVVGAAIGALGGAIAGLVCGLGAIVSAASNGWSCDAKTVGVMLIGLSVLGAIAGLGYGAFEGARLTRNYVYSSVHGTLFKPTTIGNKMDKVVNAKTLVKSLGKQLIEQQVRASLYAPSKNIEQGIFTLIGEYSDHTDKEMAAARPTLI